MTRRHDLGRQPVPVELMRTAMELIAELPEADRTDYTSRTLVVIRLLRDRNLPDNVRREYLHGLLFRLEALTGIHNHKAYQAWSMKSGTPGMDYIHADLVEAAASEPLVIDDHTARFNPDAFFSAVLKIADARGNA